MSPAARVDVVIADPPWQFRDSLPGPTRGASKQYECLSLDDLHERKAFAFPSIGPNAVLFLWLVESMQQEALSVANSWGFEAKTSGVWIKRTVTGKRQFGMGRYLRAEHERFLICTRGKAPVANKSVRSTFEAPVGVHSAKPDAFYDLVEALYPFSHGTRHFELFARTVRPGYVQFGDQLGSLKMKGTGT